MWLTCGRAPLAILAVLFSLANVFVPKPAFVAMAVIIMAISALTDLFDGFFARKWNVQSRLGALADPLMDKVFYAVALPAATFIALYNENITHAAVLLALDVVSMIRDQWVSFLRSVATEYDADVRANWSGKLRTAIGFPIVVVIHLQLGVATLILRHNSYEGIANIPDMWMFAIEGTLIAITLISAASYTMRYMPYLRMAAKHE
jgi:CDP-diacylglycerol--glycerol-3-phosphate 3-phosphatidyltransferase